MMKVTSYLPLSKKNQTDTGFTAEKLFLQIAE